MTGGRGAQLILDAISGDSLKKGYRLLAPTGRLGMFGVSSAATSKTGHGCLLRRPAQLRAELVFAAASSGWSR